MLVKSIVITALLLLLFNLGDKFETITPPGYKELKSTSQKVVSKKINLESTRLLFSKIKDISLGDINGKVEMRDTGILIHPGDNAPTKVTFNLNSEYRYIKLSAFIAKLPEDALKIKEAGTTGMKVMTNGQLVKEFSVTRNASVESEINVTNIDTISVIVDNLDGKPWFDWLMLGILDLK